MTGSTRWIDNIDVTQIFALAASASIIGSAEIPDASKMEIGGALGSDVFNGNHRRRNFELQSRYAAAAQSSSGGGSGSSSQSSSGGGALKTYNATISCPSGVSNTIPVPYRTELCRVAAIDFAKTFSCNLMDQERVMRNCQAACGHPQCLE